jgi:hypothetical protein
MKRSCCCVNVALVAILLVACTAKRQAGDLTVGELFRRGREFDGKHVAVIGYYVSGLEETCLWSTPEAANHFELLEDHIFPRQIWVEPRWRRVSRLANRYVRVVGTFHFRPEFRREMLKRDDGREFESITTLGYGHMSGSPAELTNVTFFRPLR